MKLTGPLWVVAILSAALLGFEISLLRILLVASWHHFAFLVISLALLGFGVSGTVLALFRGWLLNRGHDALLALALATAIAMPLATHLAQQLPVEARFVPLLVWRHAAHWLLYWALLGTPFLLGASAIGLALMLARERAPTMYAANLAGSGLGAALAPVAMTLVAPGGLPALWGTVAFCAACGVCGRAASIRWGVVGATALVLGTWMAGDPPRLGVDPFKYAAQLRQLEEQGSAARRAASFGPRGVVEIYESALFHDVPFLSGEVEPPPMHALVVDGHPAGSVLRIDDPDEAEALDHTLMAFAYLLVPATPAVLLLGERSGLNVWLAARRRARSITVVQPDSAIFDMIRQTPGLEGRRVFDLPGVRAVAQEPRHFVERSRETYDLVQLASLETSLAGSGGMEGLGQDILVTVSGLAACLERLAPDGLLAVSRGIQTPPRDNLKLLATLVSALRRRGVARPEEHVVIVRDFLAVSTLVSVSPWDEERIDRLRELVRERQLTPVWFPGVKPSELNWPDELQGPTGEAGDWYHHAARELFSPHADAFIDSWLHDIRPPTDDRPFFLDFCRLRSVGPLKKAYGDLWVTRAELAFLFLLAAMAIVALLGLGFTVLPLALLGKVRGVSGKGVTAVYFLSIGLAYLFLEMVALSKLTLLVGDPVHAAALTLSTFLIYSGAGSLAAQRVRGSGARPLRWVVAGLAAVAVAETLGLGPLARSAAGLSFPLRLALGGLVTAPLAFPMGFLMPLGLARLDRGAPALVPWAWGINGFASVLAAPLATALAMTWGFRIAGLAAVILYGLALGVFSKMPGGPGASPGE